MDINELFKMALANDEQDRLFADNIVEHLMERGDREKLQHLFELLNGYQDYPGYDVVVFKEKLEEKLVTYLAN